MGAAGYRTTDIDVSGKNLEEYLSDYVADRGSVGNLDDRVPWQVAKDNEYDASLPGRKYLTKLFRYDDMPDYEEMLEDSVDVDELGLDHLDAEGYGEDALDDYREAIEDALAE